MASKIIGEGSYGCVYRPRLPCSKRTNLVASPSKEWISKAILSSNVNAELAMTRTADAVDPDNEFHVETLGKCKPKNSPKVNNDLHECKATKSTPIRNISLIVSEYGGYNLNDFITYQFKHSHATYPNLSARICVALHNLLRGLVAFQSHRFVHNDIKPDNVVYNPATNQMKFIDMGISKTADEYMQCAESNTCPRHEYFVYPPILKYINRSYFDKLKSKPTSADFTVKDVQASLSAMDGFLAYTSLTMANTADVLSSAGVAMQDIIQYRRKFNNTSSFERWAAKIIQMIDIFGLGVVIATVMKFIMLYDLSSRAYTKPIYTFATTTMCSLNPGNVHTDARYLLVQYESLLTVHNVPALAGATFVKGKYILSPVATSGPKSASPASSLSVVPSLSPPVSTLKSSFRHTKKSSLRQNEQLHSIRLSSPSSNASTESTLYSNGNMKMIGGKASTRKRRHRRKRKMTLHKART